MSERQPSHIEKHLRLLQKALEYFVNRPSTRMSFRIPKPKPTQPTASPQRPRLRPGAKKEAVK